MNLIQTFNALWGIASIEERKQWDAEGNGADVIRNAELHIEKRDKLIGAMMEIANNAIYFDDSSDYRSALYDICRSAGMTDKDIGVTFIEESNNE